LEEHEIYMKVPVKLWEFQLVNTENYTIETLHGAIKKIIIDSGDFQKRRTNLKADMTDYNMMHHDAFRIVAQNVEHLIKKWVFENTPGQLHMQINHSSCWGASYSKNDYAVKHSHFPALFSYIYYVQASEDSAPLYFPAEPGTYYKPTSGTGIIFPGWVEHEVPAHETSDERIAVVGNLEGTIVPNRL